MRIKLLVLLFCIGLISCTEKEDKELETINIKVKTVRGMQVPLKSELDTINPPKIIFEKPLHNFGTINQGDKVTHDFVFKNTGKSPLIIIDAKASCGCTVPSIPDTPIAPGEKGSIKVVFDSKGKFDKQSKTIRISANTYPEPITRVVLEGYVEK